MNAAHRHRPAAAALVSALLVALAPPSSLRALETDHLTVLARPLRDSTGAIDARFNLELTRALADLQIPGKPPPHLRHARRAVRRVRRGDSATDAANTAVHRGVIEERGINGTLASGAFSSADLEAACQGMRFSLSLCSGRSPSSPSTADWRRVSERRRAPQRGRATR